MTIPLLNMSGISKRFGATQALKSVSLDAMAGQVLSLIGENGAGKSTLMKILSGAILPDAGEIRVQGNIYHPQHPQHAREAGIAMIYQELNLAPDLSVEDNIMLGQEVKRRGLLQRKEQRAKVHAALDLLGHPELHPETPVHQLSVGAQQLVEIARALVMDARLIVFDEPTSSLTAKDVERLFGVIRTLKAKGLGIIYISHFLEEIREICDCYSVLRDGESVGNGDIAGATDTEIVAMMVGRSVEELFPSVPHTTGDVILSLNGFSGSTIPENVSFDLHRGEILGISGLVGAGRTELLRCLFALDPVRTGTVKIVTNKDRATVPRHEPRARIRAGMGLVSEDRKTEGLAQNRSIGDNITLSQLEPYSKFGWLNLKKRRAAIKQWMQTLQVKAHSQDQAVQELSGGNQQKVAIARVMHQDAEIFLLDEPTRGIDVGTKAEIYRLIGELAAQGKAVLFVSSYLTELLAVCDRVGVMARGRLREIRPVSEWTEEAVMSVAVSSEK